MKKLFLFNLRKRAQLLVWLLVLNALSGVVLQAAQTPSTHINTSDRENDLTPHDILSIVESAEALLCLGKTGRALFSSIQNHPHQKTHSALLQKCCKRVHDGYRTVPHQDVINVAEEMCSVVATDQNKAEAQKKLTYIQQLVQSEPCAVAFTCDKENMVSARLCRDGKLPQRSVACCELYVAPDAQVFDVADLGKLNNVPANQPELAPFDTEITRDAFPTLNTPKLLVSSSSTPDTGKMVSGGILLTNEISPWKKNVPMGQANQVSVNNYVPDDTGTIKVSGHLQVANNLIIEGETLLVNEIDPLDPSTTITFSGSISLPVATPANNGSLQINGVPFLHNYGIENTFVGANAGNFSLTGDFNVGVGVGSLFSNTEGTINTAIGAFSLLLNTSGSINTAVGAGSLYSNREGSGNTSVGFLSLAYTQSSFANTAVGTLSLLYDSVGDYNTAIGFETLVSNTAGSSNTAVGAQSLSSNTTGTQNTAVGDSSLYHNTRGDRNVAVGASSLFANTLGGHNVAVGYESLKNNITGGHNTALGDTTLFSLTTGNQNIAIGSGSGSGYTGSESGNIIVGNSGTVGESDVIRIGTTGSHSACYIAGIDGATISGGCPVHVDSNGKLGTITSSQRYKDEVKDMGKASENLLKLRPVSFKYKKEIDPVGLLQYGLVAEEVAKIAPDLVVYSPKDGQPETVRYHLLVPMILNEYQKQNIILTDALARLDALEKSVAVMKSTK